MLFVVGGQHDISSAGVIQARLVPQLPLGLLPQACQPAPCCLIAAPRLPSSLPSCPQKMCEQLNVPCAVIAVPKSIDNDFLMVLRCTALRMLCMLALLPAVLPASAARAVTELAAPDPAPRIAAGQDVWL